MRILDKSHGHNKLNIRILKLCGESIYKLLNPLLKSCLDLETDQFPSEWKKLILSQYFINLH